MEISEDFKLRKGDAVLIGAVVEFESGPTVFCRSGDKSMSVPRSSIVSLERREYSVGDIVYSKALRSRAEIIALLPEDYSNAAVVQIGGDPILVSIHQIEPAADERPKPTPVDPAEIFDDPADPPYRAF